MVSPHGEPSPLCLCPPATEDLLDPQHGDEYAHYNHHLEQLPPRVDEFKALEL
jgi:hypothetical protein